MSEHAAQPPPATAWTVLFHRLWGSPHLLLIATMLFWSSNVILGRTSAGLIPPVALASWRWVGAFILALALAAPHLRRDLPVLARAWPTVAILALLGISGYNTFLYLGLAESPVLNVAVLLSSTPVVILLCSFLFMLERPSARQLAGVVISLAGVLIVSFRADPSLVASFALGPGMWWIAAAVVSYAVYSVVLRRAPPVHPLSLLAAMFFAGLCFLAPFHVHEHFSGAAVQADVATVAIIAYIAVGPGFLAYLAYNRAVELVGANRAGQFLHLIPLLSSAWAILLLGEDVRLFHLGGGALVITGLVLAIRPRKEE